MFIYTTCTNWKINSLSFIVMETSPGELGITCANLSIDMQLYMVGQQVKWYIGYGLTPESVDRPAGFSGVRVDNLPPQAHVNTTPNPSSIIHHHTFTCSTFIYLFTVFLLVTVLLHTGISGRQTYGIIWLWDAHTTHLQSLIYTF